MWWSDIDPARQPRDFTVDVVLLQIEKKIFVSAIVCIYFNFQHLLNFSKNYLPNLLFLMISYIFYNCLAKQRILLNCYLS